MNRRMAAEAHEIMLIKEREREIREENDRIQKRKAEAVSKFETVCEQIGIEKMKKEAFTNLRKIQKNMWRKHMKAMKKKALEEAAFVEE